MNGFLLAAMATVAWADPLKVDSTGDVQWSRRSVTDFPVDPDGNTLGQDPVYTQRIRTGLAVQNEKVLIATEWDLFTGQIGGDTWDIPIVEDDRERHRMGVFNRSAFKPRRGSIVANLPVAQIEAGLVTSHWGLGMLANDGAHDPWFGENEFGDRVVRLRLTTRPAKDSPISLSFAFDRVVEDDSAEWSEYQWASQGIVALLYADDNKRMFGVYGVARHQREILEERETRVAVIDVFGDLPFEIGSGWTSRLAMEAAGMSGKTDRATTYNSRDNIRIEAGGATGIATISAPEDRVALNLVSGWASGDGDPDDDVSHDFSFDRDFGVGQVMFDEVMGGTAAAAQVVLSNPEYVGQAPDGVEALVNEGAFKRAAFVQPIIDGRPVDWLLLRVGWMMAWSTGPVRDPFTTYRMGGVPHNIHGKPTTGYKLGSELDWAMVLGDVDLSLGPLKVKPSLKIEGGHAFLGENLQGAGPNRIDLYRATARLRW